MHREKELSNKTQAFKKSIIMDIWVIGTLNQLFITGSYTQIKFKKKKKELVRGKTYRS